jgi:hypothetical protein
MEVGVEVGCGFGQRAGEDIEGEGEIKYLRNLCVFTIISFTILSNKPVGHFKIMLRGCYFEFKAVLLFL